MHMSFVGLYKGKSCFLIKLVISQETKPQFIDSQKFQLSLSLQVFFLSKLCIYQMNYHLCVHDYGP